MTVTTLEAKDKDKNKEKEEKVKDNERKEEQVTRDEEDEFISNEESETPEETEERLEKIAKGKGEQLKDLGKPDSEDLTEEEAAKLSENAIDPNRIIKERQAMEPGDFDSLPSPDTAALLSPEEADAERQTQDQIRLKFLVEQAKKPIYKIWVITGHDPQTGKDIATRKPYKYHGLTVKERKKYMIMKAKAADLDKKRYIPALQLPPELKGRDLHLEFVNAEYDYVQFGVEHYFHMSLADYENSKFVDCRDNLMAAEYRELKTPLRQIT